MAARWSHLGALVSVACLTASTEGLGIKAVAGKAQSVVSFFNVNFVAPRLTPLEFLIVSSPTERKIVYTQLKNFKTNTGRTYALVDAGLKEPCGIAFDRRSGGLYVADRQAKAIYRYRITVKKEAGLDPNGDPQWSLATDGIQLPVLQDTQVEWVTVDVNGDVFYSDKGSKSINRIPVFVIDALAHGDQQRAMSLAAEARKLFFKKAPSATVVTSPYALPIYLGSINPHVTVPAGLASDGMRLYWANSESGRESGAVAMGEVDPHVPANLPAGVQRPPFPSFAVANNTNKGFGVAKSANMVFFSSSDQGRGVVYGVMDGEYPVLAEFATGLMSPRGLAWDGDQTLFVADEAGDTVYSFPVGRMTGDAPLAKSAQLRGAFGVAIFSSEDKAFSLGQTGGSTAAQRPGPYIWALALVATLGGRFC
mmetsp:Transcript_71759/g.158695  ORF Transcript_71759/g.158695 Transcript_71759/m.158695 type:complete len:423 (+) Transcript_71759:187-1455(+)